MDVNLERSSRVPDMLASIKMSLCKKGGMLAHEEAYVLAAKVLVLLLQRSKHSFTAPVGALRISWIIYNLTEHVV